MLLKTVFEICCCSHHSLCNLLFLNDDARDFNKNQRSRIIYCVFFLVNVFFWMFLRTDMEGFLQAFYQRYKCAVILDMLSCFEVNMLLRNSFAMVLFFGINASLVASRNKFSIYFNEKLWILKIMIFIVCFSLAMSMSLYFMFSFAIVSKYLSIAIQIFMLTIVHDSLLILIDKSILPNLQASKCLKILKIIFGYILPSALSLGVIVINFIKFTGICASYLVVTLVTLILSAIFLAVNFMRVTELNIITSLWYTAVL